MRIGVECAASNSRQLFERYWPTACFPGLGHSRKAITLYSNGWARNLNGSSKSCCPKWPKIWSEDIGGVPSGNTVQIQKQAWQRWQEKSEQPFKVLSVEPCVSKQPTGRIGGCRWYDQAKSKKLAFSASRSRRGGFAVPLHNDGHGWHGKSTPSHPKGFRQRIQHESVRMTIEHGFRFLRFWLQAAGKTSAQSLLVVHVSGGTVFVLAKKHRLIHFFCPS